MNRRATKTEPEREDEEAERLVKPLPKKNPPRRDRRRERMKPDSDPDVEDPDPDMSKNYKDIGGSSDFFESTYSSGGTVREKSERTAVYHGVEPYDDVEPYPEWEQAHQRDLGEEDFEKILTAARDWLKTPILSENVEGVVRDQQLRVALDLAIQTSKYNRAIRPKIYNELLARLAGIPEPGLGQTLLTIRGSTCTVGRKEAMDKSAMSDAARELELYLENISDLSPDGPRGQGREIVKNLLRKQKSGKYDKRLSVKLWMYLVDSAAKRYDKEMGTPGVPWHKAFTKRDRLEVAESLARSFDERSKRGEFSHVDIGRGRAAETENVAMTTKLSKDQVKEASEILGRMDKLATDIQKNHESWGMSFEDAKTAVNHIDRAADTFEAATFGEGSLQTRQQVVLAKVVKAEPDEPYMATFNNPHQPHQTDADEPYMAAYADDDSSAVEGGVDGAGQPLT